MTIFLTVDEVVDMHRDSIDQAGGSHGVRDPQGLDSAVAQPQMTFGGIDLYPTLAAKAAALGFSLVMNHPFIDGNKRIGFVAMESFLVANGFELVVDVDDAEKTILQLAAGTLSRDSFAAWVAAKTRPKSTLP